MTLSVKEITQMRENVTALLDELKLEAYLFEIEPKERQWEINVECAIEDGWEMFRLTAEKEYLLRGVDDAIVRDVLLDNWREALSACRIKT